MVVDESAPVLTPLAPGRPATAQDAPVPSTQLRVDEPPVGTVVGVAVEDAVAEGETISCKKGCGACCRQLVPISQVEARRIRDLVEAMPEALALAHRFSEEAPEPGAYYVVELLREAASRS